MARSERIGLLRLASNRGAILIIAVILVVVVVGFSAAMLVASNALTQRALEDESIARSKVVAEEGIDRARVHLLSLVDSHNVQDPSAAWDDVLSSEGGVPVEFRGGVTTKEGSYAFRVLDNDDGDGDPRMDQDMMVVVESTGRAAGQGRTIRAVVRAEPYDPTAEYAILTEDNLYLWGNQTTDGTLTNVHTNRNLYLWGSPDVRGRATASKRAWGWGNYKTEGGTARGPLHANFPFVSIPPVVIAAYRPKMEYVLTRDGRVLDRSGMTIHQSDPVRWWRNSFRGMQWSPWGWYTHHGANPQDGSYYDGGMTRALTTSYRLPVKSWQEDVITNADASTQQ